MNCLTVNCDNPVKNNETKYCQKHKCNHCNDEAIYFNIACVKHKNFDGGPFTYPDENGVFEKK
jgi:hypothetical protein